MYLPNKFTFELKFKDGAKQSIDWRFVMRYSVVHEENEQLRDTVREGTGGNMDYLMQLMRKNLPIIISKKECRTEDEDIERIIDTTDLCEIIPVY